MGRCWGITKRIWRCKNNAGAGRKWFCDTHSSQPRYFVAIALSSILFSYIAGWLLMPREREGLRPSDFQVRLLVGAHMVAFDSGYEPPQTIRLYASVGPMSVRSDLVLSPEPAREFPSVKNPTRAWEYVDRNPFIDGLKESLSLDDLVGQALSAHVPVRAFKFKSSATSFQLYIHVRGREIMVKPDATGKVEVQITKELLSGG